MNQPRIWVWADKVRATAGVGLPEEKQRLQTELSPEKDVSSSFTTMIQNITSNKIIENP